MGCACIKQKSRIEINKNTSNNIPRNNQYNNRSSFPKITCDNSDANIQLLDLPKPEQFQFNIDKNTFSNQQQCFPNSESNLTCEPVISSGDKIILVDNKEQTLIKKSSNDEHQCNKNHGNANIVNTININNKIETTNTNIFVTPLSCFNDFSSVTIQAFQGEKISHTNTHESNKHKQSQKMSLYKQDSGSKCCVSNNTFNHNTVTHINIFPANTYTPYFDYFSKKRIDLSYAKNSNRTSTNNHLSISNSSLSFDKTPSFSDDTTSKK